MTLYSIVKSLLIPPGGIILILLAAFVAARGVMARLLIFIALSTLTLMSLPVVATLLMQPLETYPALDLAEVPRSAEAILVLGAGRRTQAPEYAGDTLDDLSLRRVRYGAYLHRATGLPVYVTGGALANELKDDKKPLGRLMAEVLESDYGIRVTGAETRSRTTWENAAYSAPMLEGDGIRHILLVTDAWHLPRAVELFEKAGLEVTPAPTAFVHHPGWLEDMGYGDWLPSIRALSSSAYAIHEHLGRVWYQVRGWLEGEPDLRMM